MARFDDRLTPPDPRGLAAALRFQGRERPHNADVRRPRGRSVSPLKIWTRLNHNSNSYAMQLTQLHTDNILTTTRL